MIMNIVRQPKYSIRKVSRGTAIAVPRDEAQLKMPVARPRSRGLQDAGAEELAEPSHQSAEHLREGPEAQAAGQQNARPQSVDHRAGRQLREGVSPQEGREQVTHIGDRQPEVFANQRIGDRQGRAVDVVDHARYDQHGQRDALDRFEARRRREYRRHFVPSPCLESSPPVASNVANRYPIAQ
jgi:hypothetical protein